MNQPSAEAQIVFLQKMQRLFVEGEFSATYKFALVLTLAELAVEWDEQKDDILELPMPLIGEKFAELYWRQLATYSSGQTGTIPAVLNQNYGQQAAVIRHLAYYYRISGGQIIKARHEPGWRKTIRDVITTVRKMPLQHLQIIGGSLDPFLYDYPGPVDAVRLKPGVAFHLRRYQGLVQQLARAGWVNHIRSNRLNTPMLGQTDDLETFMFGSSRGSLAEVAGLLATLQSNRCFYCQEKIRHRAEVDHFIPWARYPRDTAHNFVLTHGSCNNNKRDMLAAYEHLERWLNLLEQADPEMSAQLSALGFVTDANLSGQIAKWAYGQAAESSALAWIAGKQTEPIARSYLELFRLRNPYATRSPDCSQFSRQL